ncbi:MAG: adenine-specific methyltransferase EcoRI family protein [Synergistaceae bacterium]|nr:adenine-specific methyltransferase EcoRI family protein [Synergistaceae bacterium]
MARRANHSLLDLAKRNKRDEFYTLYSDIERELRHYEAHFRNKVVFCNCDDPRNSNFFKYFTDNFYRLGIRKVICSCYRKYDNDLFSPSTEHGFYYEYTGRENIHPDDGELIRFHGDGDFRSEESIALLKLADIVVTNPPFSLFREYIAQLMAYRKKFLIISSINAITYKEVFTLIQANRVWLGVNFGRGISGFIVPEDYELYGTEARIDASGRRIISPNNCLWLTNMDNFRRHEFINLTKHYTESKYPAYDNYLGINADRTEDIPCDYFGAVGVPITFLHKYNPEQFEILGFRKGLDGRDLSIGGRCPYFRILIRRRKYPSGTSEGHQELSSLHRADDTSSSNQR